MFDENTQVGCRNRLETRKLYLHSVFSPGRGSVIKTLKRVDLTRGTKIVGSDRIPTAVTFLVPKLLFGNALTGCCECWRGYSRAACQSSFLKIANTCRPRREPA